MRRRDDDEEGARALGGARRLLAQRRLGGGEARDRHPERRARYIIQPDLVAERDRGGVAAMLAADAELEVLPHLASALGGDAHQLAHAFAVEGHERVGG